jgi:phenylpropionate dioxygenase-like ring-hydroxylating dioxygenase large terminal subunit
MASSSTENPPIIRNAWYVAGYSTELKPNAVLGRKLLGTKYALFRRPGGALGMVRAACPHRGSDLSRGRLVGDCLRCPMHGWEFDADGRCTKVPSQPDTQKIPPGARLEVAEIREQQGLIWVWLGDKAELCPVPAHDEWNPSPGRRCYFEAPRLWKCSFVNAVENAIDTTHIPFMHPATLGAGSRALYPRQEIIVDEDGRGFAGRDAPESPWGERREAALEGGPLIQLLGRLLGVGPIESEQYRFDLGGSLFYKVQYANGTWEVLVAHSTPASDTETWFFGVSVRTRGLHFLADVFQRWFARTLVDEDEDEVSAMLSNDPRESFPLVSVVGDEPLLTFRRLWERQSRKEHHGGRSGFRVVGTGGV